MKHKLKSKLMAEISITQIHDDTTLLAESKEDLKSLLMKVKEESEKAGLKLISVFQIIGKSWLEIFKLIVKTASIVNEFYL